MSIHSASVTALILAGGRATRMQNLDKGLVELNGKRMIEIICEKISKQCSTILINANRNIDTYKQLHHQVIEDQISGYQGPLAGFHAGLQHSQTPWIITLPCDGPFINDNYVEKMLTACSAEKTQIAVAKNRGRLQPVYCLIHKEMLSSLTRYLHSDNRKIDLWFAQHTYSIVDFSDAEEKMFTNINTLDELQTLEETN